MQTGALTAIVDRLVDLASNAPPEPLAPAIVAEVKEYQRSFTRMEIDSLVTSGKPAELVVWARNITSALSRHSTYAPLIYNMPYEQWQHDKEGYCRLSLDPSDEMHSHAVGVLADDRALGAFAAGMVDVKTNDGIALAEEISKLTSNGTCPSFASVLKAAHDCSRYKAGHKEQAAAVAEFKATVFVTANLSFNDIKEVARKFKRGVDSCFPDGVQQSERYFVYTLFVNMLPDSISNKRAEWQAHLYSATQRSKAVQWDNLLDLAVEACNYLDAMLADSKRSAYGAEEDYDGDEASYSRDPRSGGAGGRPAVRTAKPAPCFNCGMKDGHRYRDCKLRCKRCGLG